MSATATATATATDAPTTNPAAGLLDFNQQVLDQAVVLLAHFGTAGPSSLPGLAGPVGAHLRHIIEHYTALVFRSDAGVVDYDSRPRERALESDPLLASACLHALRLRLAGWPVALLDTPVRVRGQAGLLGDRRYEVASTVGRELAFVASHAIHHFAMLAPYGRALGIDLPADFGKAPSTMAYERAVAVTPDPVKTPETKETPCLALHPSA